MSRPSGLLPVVRRVLALGFLGSLAACGSSAPAASNASTTASTTTTTAPLLVPTTTLPPLPGASSLSGTTPSGSLADLGPIRRVPVAPVSVGAATPQGAGGTAQDLSDIDIAYRRFGSGPDLLLIMGQHGTMTWWDPQFLSDLSAQFNVTVFDLPGVGYSEALPSPPTISSYADTTAGLIDAIGLRQPVVLGWGLGGQVALAIVERHPGLVSRLVLADTGVTSTVGASENEGAASELAEPVVTTTELSYLLFPSTAEVDRVDWLASIAEVPPDDIVASAISGEANAEAELARHPVVANDLAAVGVTVLVIVGAHDAVFPEREASALAKALPAARLLVLANAGYASLMQDETRVVQAIVSFALQ